MKTLSTQDLKKVGILLAGSSGSKFWPLSNRLVPEQFVCLFDDTTLFQKIYKLVSKQIDNENIYAVGSERFKQLVMEQSPLQDSNYFIEPMLRQTAPALGLALTLIDDHYSDDTLICVFPSDQMINNYEEFNSTLEVAYQAAFDLDALVTIGIEPESPAPYFGYIQYCPDINDKRNSGITKELFDGGLRKSINFVEKPDEETAKRFINTGGFVWNSGILIAKKSVLIKAYAEFLDYHYEKFQQIKPLYKTENYAAELQNLYKTFNKISIDYGILEYATNIYVIKSTFSWIDYNNWNELHRMLRKDAMDNVHLGSITSIDTYDSLVYSPEKHVAIMGCEDIVVINTDTALLVCKKSESYKINNLVSFLRTKNIPIY